MSDMARSESDGASGRILGGIRFAQGERPDSGGSGPHRGAGRVQGGSGQPKVSGEPTATGDDRLGHSTVGRAGRTVAAWEASRRSGRSRQFGRASGTLARRPPSGSRGGRSRALHRHPRAGMGSRWRTPGRDVRLIGPSPPGPGTACLGAEHHGPSGRAPRVLGSSTALIPLITVRAGSFRAGAGGALTGQLLLPGVAGQPGGPVELAGGLSRAAQPEQQVSAHARQQVVGAQ